jgi:repressor LexA
MDPTDRELAEFIWRYGQEHGYSPSVRDLCEAFGWRSSSTGHDRMKRLEQNGIISIGLKARRPISVHFENLAPVGKSEDHSLIGDL